MFISCTGCCINNGFNSCMKRTCWALWICRWAFDSKSHSVSRNPNKHTHRKKKEKKRKINKQTGNTAMNSNRFSFLTHYYLLGIVSETSKKTGISLEVNFTLLRHCKILWMKSLCHSLGQSLTVHVAAHWEMSYPLYSLKQNRFGHWARSAFS